MLTAARYTDQEVQLVTTVMKTAIATLTVGQRMELGTVDYSKLSVEILDFFAASSHDFTSEATLLAGTSDQFKALYKFGFITIELS